MGCQQPAASAGGSDVAVRLNGEPRDVPPGTTVEDVVRLIAPQARGVAVAVNGEVLPRSAWSASVAPGDDVEVLTAAQGG